MNTLRTIFFSLLSFASISTFAQSASIEFSLQLLEDGKTFGVFVRPDNTIAPSANTATGSGQVTLVTPVNFTYANFKNVSGTWVENARVNAPVEATDKAYVSFGFMVDEPRIQLFPNEETLLFTFTCSAAFSGSIALFDNENDPFNAPNSLSSNPGNDLGMVDYGAEGGLTYYLYSKNYSPLAPEFNSAPLAANNEE